MGFRVVVSAGIVVNPRLVGLVVLHRACQHHAPFDVGLVGGASVVVIYRDLQVFRRNAAGGFTARQEVEVASDKVDRAALFVVLCVAVSFSIVFGSLPLGGVVHFEVVKRGR